MIRCKILWFLFIVLTSSCKTSASIESAQPASIVRLDEKFQVFARLGDLPIPLKEKEPVTRYAIAPRGRSPEYLILVSPTLANGKIEVPLKEAGASIESAVFYNTYLDRILRVHRLILQGHLQEAKKDLLLVDQTFDHTFGSYVMAGNIAVLEKRYEDAALYFENAKKIFPEATYLSEKSGENK